MADSFQKDQIVAEDGFGQTDDYRVRLDTYEGPLDLLLRLIEREELDITTVSLALVTDQYLAHLAQLQEVRAESLAEFLVIAAKLLYIKSQALLPRPPAVAVEQEEDVGDELVQQLIIYRRFKRAAAWLAARDDAGFRAYVRAVPTPRLERHLDLSEVSLPLLAALMREVLTQDGPLPDAETIAPLQISIGDKMRLITRLLGEQPAVRFGQLLRACGSRLEIIVTFLAVLEMLKQLHLRVEQEELFGEIVLLPPEGNQPSA